MVVIFGKYELAYIKSPVKISSKFDITVFRWYDWTTELFQKAAGSQDDAAEEEEESGDEADLAKYDLWGSEDEGSKTGSTSKPAGKGI